MSIANLISEPTEYNALSRGVWYEFSLSSTGAAQEFLAYQIYKGDGTPISEIEAVDPRGNNVHVNIARELEGYIDSGYPEALNGVNVQNENEIIGEFYLRYGTIDVDEVDGVCETTIALEGFTNTINVIRSTPQYDDQLEYDTAIVLSKQPKCTVMHRDAEAWVTIFAPDGGSVQWTKINKDGTTAVVANGTLAYDVNLVPISPAAFGGAAWYDSDVVSLQTVISGMDIDDVVYNIGVKGGLSQDHAEVHFLEPLGSWVTVCFETNRGNAQVSYEGGIICSGVRRMDEIDLLGGSAARLSGANYGIVNRKATMSLSLIRKDMGRIEAIKTHRAMLSGRKAYAIVTGYDGSRVRVNFLLSSGSAELIQRGTSWDLIVTGDIILDSE